MGKADRIRRNGIEPNLQVRLVDVVDAVTKWYGVHPDVIFPAAQYLRDRLTPNDSLAGKMIIHMALRCGYSYKSLAEYFNRDQKSIRYHAGDIEIWQSAYPNVNKDRREIEKYLYKRLLKQFEESFK